MEDKGKKLAIGLIITGGIGALIFAATRVKAAPPPEVGPAAQVTIKIRAYNSQSRLAPSNSPLELVEGKEYIAEISVTNATTRAGVPWDATLILTTACVIGEYPNEYWVIPEGQRVTVHDFVANETKLFTEIFTIPVGWGGLSGNVTCQIFATLAQELGAIATASLDFTTIAEEIIYGATIGIAV